ncbi:class I SAM-dependent methyltransferase [Sphingomonas sp. 1P06PA]|uniref:class I SAM-dependent methyltransferase n=1 Tax=Sphingomonas sp. 1P06PA TaxID=554121 RepID=UPI0039A4C03A
MKPIDLQGFDRKFVNDADPWSTFTSRDEARKRSAILRGLGNGPVGRVLELAAGNGSNSVALARFALRLDATEGTESGTDLVRRAVPGDPRVRVTRLVLPDRFPRHRYDAVIIAEVLYYLSPGDMAKVACAVAQVLRPGGRLIMAHHRVDYPDFVQHADGIHRRFIRDSHGCWARAIEAGTGRWRVQTFIRL